MAGEDRDRFAECWAHTLLFLPWIPPLLQGVGSRGLLQCSPPMPPTFPVSSALAASVKTSLE